MGPTDPPSDQADPRPHVLVLDPDPRVSEALALALRKVACVERLPRGMGGLITAAEGRVDMVIAQADLPDVSTGELVRLLRVLRPRIPIAVLGERRSPLAWPDDIEVRFPAPFDLRRCVGWVTDRIARPPARTSGEEEGKGAEIPIQHVEIVHWVLAFIERRHRDGTRLATIARLAGVSRLHLCRIFRRVTGESLKRFLTRRRLQEAKVLLRNPGLTIQQVSSAVGYRDVRRFDRVFRLWEGQSPSHYRYHTLARAPRRADDAEILRPPGVIGSSCR